MKTRILHTSVYKEDFMEQAPKDVRWFYHFLLSNDKIGLTGIYKIRLSEVLEDTALTEDEIKEAKAYLQENKKAFFYNNWVYVTNTEKFNKYSTGGKTALGYAREYYAVPADVIEYFLSQYEDSYLTKEYVDTIEEVLKGYVKGIYTPNKTENRNKKTESVKQKTEIPFSEAMKSKLRSKGIMVKEDGNIQLLVLIISAAILIISGPILLQKPKPIVVYGEEPKVVVELIASEEAELKTPSYPRDRSVEVQAKIEEVSTRMFGGHVESFKDLAFKESGFNPYAQNGASGACGLPQAMPCSKMNCELGDVDCQVEWMASYIERRYGNPTNALTHWNSRQPINGVDVGHWY